MHTAENNPTSNQLGSGISEDDISKAVSKSGYPLQTVIAGLLRKLRALPGRETFHVQEEWGYIDRDSRELRAIDLLATKRLYDFTRLKGRMQPRVRPFLNLIIECKQSTLPYVFFMSRVATQLLRFPLIAGLSDQFLKIATDDNPSVLNLEILRALGLDVHMFVSKGPEYCATFSKCVRDGKAIELSGTKPFNELVLPLLKSMQHFQVVEAPPDTAMFFDCHMVIGVGVLDAPMVGVQMSGERNELKLLPWVRVTRYETDEIASWHETRRGLYAIDVVHKDFFEEYLSNNVIPFAEDFSRLVLKHGEELASGNAFAPSMMKEGMKGIEERLQPRQTE
jgi:hypothetical protein